MNYIQIKDVYVHSIMYLLGFDELQANLLFDSYYHNNDLNELKQIISMKEMELTNDE
jgi:hypothetical protein